MPLPEPVHLTSLVLRTDFGDDAAWESLRVWLDGADYYPSATCVSDRLFDGASVRMLVDLDAAADDADKRHHVFVADTATFAGGERTLLAVDLHDEPGRTFRVELPSYVVVAASLTMRTMVCFAEFAAAADASGTFRDWDVG